MRAQDENYVQRISGDLADLLPDCDAHLIGLYTLLALARGPATTLEDVHDAWAIWRNTTNPAHKSLVPFDALSRDVQEMDRKYMEAIHKAATVVDGPYAGEPCACVLSVEDQPGRQHDTTATRPSVSNGGADRG